MNKALSRYALWQGVFLLAIVLFLQAQDVPTIHRRVTDLTGTLNEGQTQAIEAKLAQFEQQTSNQIVVMMVPSIESGSLEEYSMSIAEKNGFGKKGRDNGVFLFISMKEKKVRIEVGYGLEGVLPDATCDEIIRHIIVPNFRNGDFAEGIDQGVQAIMLATKGEFKGTGSSGSGRGIGAIIVIILAILFTVFGGWGGGFMVGSGGYGYRRRYPGMFWGGFGGGGFGGGGFGGGGFGGGGGFSGGGGGFGGGGASGGW